MTTQHNIVHIRRCIAFSLSCGIMFVKRQLGLPRQRSVRGAVEKGDIVSAALDPGFITGDTGRKRMALGADCVGEVSRLDLSVYSSAKTSRQTCILC
ncbi:hypothetical protein CJO78_09475 [Ralstonia solanacearum]|nr:hypothetical protein LBM2029_09155 [Ralstonia solanacearum]AXV86517.1 hypothetical protein CJO78_09475 [Ralstonia solanacearum]AXW06019.1 hypothetical protein CJO82_09250 [Ralstonia solanacearum]AXW23763.1 hypothetical protein CJO86_09255 [Ralstonia solanacearum]AXW80695.1 hypothetical protein CJO98_09485 [Ralstonia solanacearum]